MLSPEQIPDDIWADPERVLAPSREDRYLRVLEQLSEERLFACWADEALQECVRYLATEPCSPYSAELFKRTQLEISQYVSVMDDLMQWLVCELQRAGRECDRDLLESPRPGIRQHIAEKVGQPEDDSKAQLFSRLVAACEYASDRVARFISRFAAPRYELLSRYPTRQLKRILIETRAELARCENIAQERWDEELDKLPEQEIVFPPNWKPAPDDPNWRHRLIADEMNRAVKARPVKLRP